MITRLKRIFLKKSTWVVLGLIVILTLVYLSRSSAKKNQSFETSTVDKKDLLQTISASGKAKAEEQVELKFQTSGLLTWVGVKEGDWVKKWQAIASLDKRELKKKLEKEMDDYLKQRWDFEQSQDDYNIQGRRLNEVMMTDTVKRILEKSQFDLNSSVLDYEIANLTVKLATITSPIEGIVTHIDCPVSGVNITPASATFTIVNPQKMLFEADIDETEVAQVIVGQKAKITLDAYPEQEFEGEVSKIGFSSITTRGGGNAFPVEVRLPENQNLRFKSGMSGDIQVILNKKADILTIPNEAIHYLRGKPYVRILENNQPKEIEIKIGLETEKETEVIAGLSDGQKVITTEKK